MEHFETKSAVFSYCRFSLFLKDPFFPDYLNGLLGNIFCFATNPHLLQHRERSGLVVECLSVVDLSLTNVTALSLSKTD